MILIIEYFIPDNEKRHKEYIDCLEQNIENKYIKNIEVFIEKNTNLTIKSNKIRVNIVEERPTFQDIFEFCNEKYSNEICIIANSDIIFDDTISNINEENIQDKFVALNRWDIKPDGSICQFRNEIGDSQDSWIFKAPINIKNADFTMGKLGCDNRIAFLAHELGMEVINPSAQVITKHLHLTNYRKLSREKSETIYGKHLIVKYSKNMNEKSILIEREYLKKI